MHVLDIMPGAISSNGSEGVASEAIHMSDARSKYEEGRREEIYT